RRSDPLRRPSPRARRLTLWSKRAARWARAQAGRFMGFSEVSREEEIVHELGRFLEGCSDLELIEKSFMESVGRLTAARSVQWIRGPVHPSSAGDGDGDGHLEIMLRAGSVARGRLLVLPPFDQPSAWSPATVKRLGTGRKQLPDFTLTGEQPDSSTWGETRR